MRSQLFVIAHPTRATVVVVLCAAMVLFGLEPATASAGTYAVQAGLPYGNASMCDLGSFSSAFPNADDSCTSSVIVGSPLETGWNVPDKQNTFWKMTAPTGLTITSVDISNSTLVGVNSGGQWGGGSFYQGTGGAYGGQSWQQGGSQTTGAIASPFYAFQVVCETSAGCTSGAYAEIYGISMTVEDDETPTLQAVGTNDLFNQTGWVWNTPSDPWSLSLAGTDPSGVCNYTATVSGPANSGNLVGGSEAPDTSVWQQCAPWTWSPSIDTNTYAPTSGSLALAVSDANQAGVANSAQTTIHVDNVAPTVSVAPLNDLNPGGWAVNHAVSVRVTPSVGPSGISSVTCSDTLGATTTPLTLTPDTAVAGAYDTTVDGNGANTVTCSAANTAVDPQGAHNTGSGSLTVDIDEQAPSINFEPVNPDSPSQVTVDTSDDESAVAGGDIQITPSGSSTPTTLPTTFTSAGQLIATIPDNKLKAGAYTVQATATSLVGNSATATEPVTLPLREHTTEAVSFAKLVDPTVTKKVRERVRVGWHYGAKLNKAGKPIKVKVGGHFKIITVVKRVERCTTKRVKVGKHRWKLRTTCVKPHLKYVKTLTVGFGRPSTLYGEVMTSQGVPVADQTVDIRTRPNNGRGRYSKPRTATTNANGGWKIALRAGPSRTIKVTYGGDGTLLPANATASLYVPAKIEITATPDRVRWTGTTTIHGQLEGAYVPKDGVAMRLLIKIPGRKELYSPAAFRTTKTGSFRIKWTWGRGSGVAAYPFSVATTANESDYPYTAAKSNAVKVTFGGRGQRRSR